MASTSRTAGHPSDIPRAPAVTTARLHRRPSGEPPPLPRRLNASGTSFVGKRLNVLPGGCVTYRFSVHGDTFVAMVDALLQGLGFVTREELASKVRELSNGRLELDAEGGGS